MNPQREGAANLPILEQPVLFVCGVKRDPREGPDLQLHSRTGRYTPSFLHHANRGKRRTQKLQSVCSLMECKYALHRRMD